MPLNAMVTEADRLAQSPACAMRGRTRCGSCARATQVSTGAGTDAISSCRAGRSIGRGNTPEPETSIPRKVVALRKNASRSEARTEEKGRQTGRVIVRIKNGPPAVTYFVMVPLRCGGVASDCRAGAAVLSSASSYFVIIFS